MAESTPGIMGEILSLVQQRYTVTERETKTLKLGPMAVTARSFEVEGLGRLSLVGSGGPGVPMTMDTVVLNPCAVDLPILSYDGIRAMGDHTLLVEYYDTTLSPFNEAPFLAVKDGIAHLPDMDPGVHWYDDIRFSCSFFKKGPSSEISEALNGAVLAAFAACLTAAAGCKQLTPEAAEEKRRKGAAYVDGLFDRGGPAADNFTRALGAEAARAFFHETVFGTK